MELDEFHIGDGCTGPGGHRHSVTGCDQGVCRMEVHLAESAGGEEHDPGSEAIHTLFNTVEGIDTPTVDGFLPPPCCIGRVVLGDQLDCRMVFKHAYIRRFRHRLKQRTFYFPSGEVLCMDDPVDRVSALPSQIQDAVLPGELHPNFDELTQTGRPLPHEDLHRITVRKAHPGGQRILDMELEGIHGRHDGRNPPLGVICI